MRNLPLFNESCAFLVANKRFTLYGCLGVNEYCSERVRIKTVDGHVTVNGRELCLADFSASEITVCGVIVSVELEERNDGR